MKRKPQPGDKRDLLIVAGILVGTIILGIIGIHGIMWLYQMIKGWF